MDKLVGGVKAFTRNKYLLYFVGGGKKVVASALGAAIAISTVFTLLSGYMLHANATSPQGASEMVMTASYVAFFVFLSITAIGLLVMIGKTIWKWRRQDSVYTDSTELADALKALTDVMKEQRDDIKEIKDKLNG